MSEQETENVCKRCGGSGQVAASGEMEMCGYCVGTGGSDRKAMIDITDRRYCLRCSCSMCRAHQVEVSNLRNQMDLTVAQVRQERVGVARTHGSSVPMEPHLDGLLRPGEETPGRSRQLELMAQHLLDLADSVVCGDALVVRESEMRSGDVVCTVFAVETRESLMNTLYHASELWQVLERRGVELMDAAERVRHGAEHRKKRDGEREMPNEWRTAWENTQLAALRFLNADQGPREAGSRRRTQTLNALLEFTGLRRQGDEYVIEKIASKTEVRLVPSTEPVAWSGAPQSQQDLHDLRQAVREWIQAERESALPRVILNDDDRREGMERLRRLQTARGQLERLVEETT